MVLIYCERSSFTEYEKDEKPNTAGLDDTAIQHINIKITEMPLEKKLSTAVP